MPMGERSRGTRTTDGEVAPGGAAYSVVLSGNPSELPAVRRAIRELATESGFGDRASDLSLVLDELVANALEHGEPPVTVRAWHDGRLVVTVSDCGGGFEYPTVLRTHPPVMLGKRGRGLWIVRQVTDHVHCDSSTGGTTVRVELTPEPHIGA